MLRTGRNLVAWLVTFGLVYPAWIFAPPAHAVFNDETAARVPADGDVSYSFAVADVDGLNGPDVLVANRGVSRLLINDGSGVFVDQSAARLPALAQTTLSVAAGDVDGVNGPDLLLATSDQNRLLINDGAGNFTDETAARLPADASLSMDVALGDLDGDGDLDAVIANRGTRNRVWINDGAGNFSDQSAGRLVADNDATYAVALGDVNGNGGLDLFFANHGTPNRLHTNNLLGTFTDQSAASLPADTARSSDAVIVDLTGDGSRDIAVADGAGGLSVLVNDGTGVFAASLPGNLPVIDEFVIKLAAGDIDFDGSIDLVLANAAQDQVLLNNGAGVFTDATGTELPVDDTRSFGLLLLDADGDLDLDLLLATPQGQNRFYDNFLAYPRIQIAVSPDYIEVTDTATITVQTFDEDGVDTVTVEVIQPDTTSAAPTDAGGGVFTFVPAQIGTHTVRVTATDLLANAGVKDATFEAQANDVIDPVVTLGIDPASVTQGQAADFSVAATDDRAVVGRTLSVGGVNVPLDAAGNATYAPLAVGTLAVVAEARDAAGNVGTDNGTIEVLADLVAPVVTLSATPDPIDITNPIAINAVATDNVRVSAFEVTVSGPDTATIALDGAGNGTYTPFIPGTYTFTATARDPAGNVTVETAFVEAQGIPDNEAPVVTLSVVPPVTTPGGTVTLTVNATDNVFVAARTLEINGVPVALDAANQATFVPSVLGDYTAVATASDPTGNVGTDTVVFSAIDPSSDVTPPTVSITTPAEGGEANGNAAIIGTASDATLVEYTLEYAPLGSGAFQTFATGNTSVIGGELGRFDTSLLENGMYQIRLSARDLNGNAATTAPRLVLLSGDAKPGAFTMTFTDLHIDLAGISLTVNRTYDSRRRATSGDFGNGWALEVVREGTYVNNRPPGEGWAIVSGGPFGVFNCGGAQATLEHVTEIRFSDTEFYRFVPQINLIQTIASICPGTVEYIQVAGVPGASLAPVGSNEIDCPSGGGNCFVDLNPANTFDPQQVVLTTLDGREFVIDRTAGVRQIEDRNGNRLQISDTNVVYTPSASPADTLTLDINRDGLQRVTSIDDPQGDTLAYAYDGNGNLQAFTDRNAGVTTYVYDADNLLLDINDPTGSRPVRNEYDASGRLVAQIGADGERTEIDTDLDAGTMAVTDRNGNTAVLEYNETGHITTAATSGGTKTFTYDARGNRLTETDEVGNTTTYTYDANDRPLSVSDALGNTTTWTYNAFGQFLTRTDPNGGVTTRTYDGNGNKLSETDALGNATAWTYDASGNVLTQTDPLGNVTAWTYDAFGNALSETNPLGETVTRTYNTRGNKLTESRTRTVGGAPVVETTTYTYDAEGQLLSVTDPLGAVNASTYNGNGRPLTETDPNGNVTARTWDTNGNLTRVDYADGTFELYNNDLEGRRTAHTDRSGNTRFFEYDDQDRITRTIEPDGGTTLHNYDAAGRLLSTTGPRGNVTQYLYDAASRLLRVTDANGGVITHTYDNKGNRTSTTDPLGNVTQFTYDALDRLIRTTYDDGTTFETAYDAAGRKVGETDQAGNTTQYEYDAAGRLLAVENALGDRTRYAYDEAGNRISQIDANGNITDFAYDAAGRLISTVRPLGMVESTTYDAAGNRLTHIAFDGGVTQFAYDAANRMVRRTLPGGAVEDIAYTGNGKRASVTDARGTTTFTYDAVERLTRRVDPDGTVVDYEYDLAGNRTAVVSPDGRTEYAYDALDRLVRVEGPDAGVTTYAYDANGNRAGVTYPNGVVTTYAYDALNRLTDVETRDDTGTLLSGYDYTLGAAGNRTRVVEAPSGRTVDYTYDAVYRLLGEDIDAGSRTVTYTYDAVGNRLSKTDSATGALTYTYDANDRLLGDGTSVYAYDARGNLVRETLGGAVTDFTWDSRNRLVLRDDGTDVVAYTYDVDGNRVRALQNGTLATNYLVDTAGDVAQVLRETDDTGAALVSYVHGDDLISQSRAGTPSYYVYDGQMSTRQLTDAAGTVTDTYDYDAFGVTLNRTGTTENRHLYAGEFLDPNSGFYYLRARWMQPQSGRFLSEDPVPGLMFDPRTLHKYTYALNNPVNRLDPGGQFSLAGLSVSVSIIQILVTIAPTVTIGIATAALINAFWKPGFTMRYGGIDIIAASRGALSTAIGMAFYRTGNVLIEVGAALISLTANLIQFVFGAASLASGLGNLASSANAIAGLANFGLVLGQIQSLIGKIGDIQKSLEGLQEAMGVSTGKKAPPPEAKKEGETLNKVAEEAIKLTLGILSHVKF